MHAAAASSAAATAAVAAAAREAGAGSGSLARAIAASPGALSDYVEIVRAVDGGAAGEAEAALAASEPELALAILASVVAVEDLEVDAA
jgi:hypothetical protein